MTLDDMIDRLGEYAEEAALTFGDLSVGQFNWKPNPDSWSIGQCLEHLVMANRKYVSLIERAQEGEYNRTIWERMPVLPGLTGKLVIKTIHPDNVKKSKAPKVFRPSRSEIPKSVLDNYIETAKRLRTLFESFSGDEIQKMIITSPVAKFATYSLYDAFKILVLHDRRHLNQAEAVIASKRFPD